MNAKDQAIQTQGECYDIILKRHKRWIKPGTIVRANGVLNDKTKLSIRIQPKVVDVQHGWWFPEEIPDKPVLYRAFESNANILTPNSDEYVDLPTGAACFYPLLCKIYPAKKYYGQ